ncbi:MAG: hypothetical protein U0793_14670 [Gemmataceae bacterium]
MVDFFPDWLHEILFQLPYLLAYIAGMVLALSFWRRYPTACLLLLLGCLVKMVASLALVFYSLFFWFDKGEGPIEMVPLLITVIDAGAYGLLLSAVFVGRRAPAPRDRSWGIEREPEREAEPRPMLRGRPDSTGIQEDRRDG